MDTPPEAGTEEHEYYFRHSAVVSMVVVYVNHNKIQRVTGPPYNWTLSPSTDHSGGTSFIYRPVRLLEVRS